MPNQKPAQPESHSLRERESTHNEEAEGTVTLP